MSDGSKKLYSYRNKAITCVNQDENIITFLDIDGDGTNWIVAPSNNYYDDDIPSGYDVIEWNPTFIPTEYEVEADLQIFLNNEEICSVVYEDNMIQAEPTNLFIEI